MSNFLFQEAAPEEEANVIIAPETPAIHHEIHEIHENPTKVPTDPIYQYLKPNSHLPINNAYENNYYRGHPYAPNVPRPQYLPAANIPATTATNAEYVPPENVLYEGYLVPFPVPGHMWLQQPSQQQSMQQQQTLQQQQMKQAVQQPAQPNSKPATMNKSNDNTGNKITPGRNSFDLAVILQALLPPNIIDFVIAIGNLLLNSLSTIAFAGAVTSALCSLTPICTLSFGMLPWSVRQVFVAAKMADNDDVTVTTIQRVRRAADLFSNALDKYEKLQKSVESLTKSLENSQKKSRAKKSFDWLQK